MTWSSSGGLGHPGTTTRKAVSELLVRIFKNGDGTVGIVIKRTRPWEKNVSPQISVQASNVKTVLGQMVVDMLKAAPVPISGVQSKST